MLRNRKKLNTQSGFTIIEVLVVLAIAGLIMVVVFLAVPNLQRSQRNNARKTDGNNMLQNLSEYVGNAAGTLPGADCGGVNSACTWISYKPAQLTRDIYIRTGASGSDAIPAAPSKITAYLIAGAICDPSNILQPTTSGATARDYVIWYGIEGSTAMVCTQGS